MECYTLYLKVVDPPLGLVVPNSAQLCWVQVVTEKRSLVTTTLYHWFSEMGDNYSCSCLNSLVPGGDNQGLIKT